MGRRGRHGIRRMPGGGRTVAAAAVAALVLGTSAGLAAGFVANTGDDDLTIGVVDFNAAEGSVPDQGTDNDEIENLDALLTMPTPVAPDGGGVEGDSPALQNPDDPASDVEDPARDNPHVGSPSDPGATPAPGSAPHKPVDKTPVKPKPHPTAPQLTPKPGTAPKPKPKPQPTFTPQPRPEPKPQPKPQPGSGSDNEQVVQLVNQARTAEGRGALTMDSCLQGVAQKWADHMAQVGRMYHQDLSNIMNGCSKNSAGENVAWGQRNAQEVHQAWWNSPGHHANIMNPRYTLIGIASAKAPNGQLYWCQVFAS